MNSQSQRRTALTALRKRPWLNERRRPGGLVTAEGDVNDALLLKHGDNPEDFLLARVWPPSADSRGAVRAGS